MHNEIDLSGLASRISALPAASRSLAFRGNLGDALIRAGQLEVETAAGRDIGRVVRFGRRIQSAVIPGGGNLVEGYYSTCARSLGSLGADTPGLIMPHTVRGLYFPLRRHPRLQIVCRDLESYDGLVVAGFEPRRLLLCDDTAFALRDSELLRRAQSDAEGTGTLIALRRDREGATDAVDPMIRRQSFDVTGSVSSRWLDSDEIRSAAQSLLEYVAGFEYVVTDRLHVAIAAFLLDLECWLLPNSYGKNAGVFGYSMHGGSVTYLGSSSEIPRSVVQLADADESRRRWGVFNAVSEPLSVREKLRGKVGHLRARAAQMIDHGSK